MLPGVDTAARASRAGSRWDQLGASAYSSSTFTPTTGTGAVPPGGTACPMEGVVMTWRPYLAFAPGTKLMRWLTGSTEATLAGSRRSIGHPGTGVPSAWKA